MKVGIIGGTFDPIHNGHLIIAEYARTSLNLDKVMFIPSGTHPFKDNKKITDAKKRIDMIFLAIDQNPYFEVSDIEIDRKGITYTIDTIISLRNRYPKYDLYFIFGLDIIFELNKWKRIEELGNLCKFILLDRPCNDKEQVKEKMKELELLYNINIEKIKSPIIEISSTEIRERVKDKLSIKYLVPDKVESYIQNNNLYQGVNIDV